MDKTYLNRFLNVNTKTLKLLLELFEFLVNYGFEINEFSLKISVINSKRTQHIRIKNYNDFVLNTKKYIRYNKDNDLSFTLCILEDIFLTNKNLEKYQSKFRVNCQNLFDPKYVDTKIRDTKNQHIIDREIERYKRLISGLLNNYRVSYGQKIVAIINDQTNLDNSAYINYVLGGYVNIDYVEPQL